MTYYDLLNETDHIHDLLEANEPASSEIRKQFAHALEITEPGSKIHEPSTRTCREYMRKAMTAFAQLPAAERKRILNGWEPPVRKSRAELIDQAKTCEYLTTFFQLELDPTSGSAGAEMSEFFDEGGSLTKTRVMFRLGTTKEEALKSLSYAKAYVEQQWDDLIGNRATDAAGRLSPLDEKEERPPLQPNDLTPEWIDAFFEDTCQKLDALGISYSEDASVLVLPGGTKRKVFSVRNHSDDGNAFLGPIVTGEDAETAKEADKMKDENQEEAQLAESPYAKQRTAETQETFLKMADWQQRSVERVEDVIGRAIDKKDFMKPNMEFDGETETLWVDGPLGAEWDRAGEAKKKEYQERMLKIFRRPPSA